MSVTDSQMLAGFDLHDVLGRSLVSKPITMHWRHNGKLGCEVLVGEAEVTSIHCSAFRYLLLKDSFCSLCMEAARNVIDQEDRELLACANALDRYVEQELLKYQLDTVMTRTPALVPYSAPRIHVSHEMDSINSPGGGSVGCCMVCREAWVNDVMTPGLTYPCTKVKPKLDPMTGHPVEFMEREGFGRQLVDAMSREPAKD